MPQCGFHTNRSSGSRSLGAGVCRAGSQWLSRSLCERFAISPGEVQRKHAAGQALPSSLLFNLITVMSLETVGCTTSNVDADKHTALAHSLCSHWQLNARRTIRLKPSIARWLIDHRNR